MICDPPQYLEWGAVLVFPPVLWYQWSSGWHRPSAQPHWSAWYTACSSASVHILWCSSSLKEMYRKPFTRWVFKCRQHHTVNREENAEIISALGTLHIWCDSFALTSSLSFTGDQRSSWEEPQTTPKPNKKLFCWWVRTVKPCQCVSSWNVWQKINK